MRPKQGLGSAEIRERRQRFGRNVLADPGRRAWWAILAGQTKSFAVLLLMAAAVVSLLLGEIAEGMAIIIVLAINAAIGFYTEWRAVRSMEALHRLSRVGARVRRDGRAVEVDSRHLVPGDIVLLSSGDIVPADLRLIVAQGLQCDESTLTGESLPISKSEEPLDAAVGVADQVNMAFKGTSATRGFAEGIVVATGTSTELGRIARLAGSAEPETTPLERRLDRLTTDLVWLTLILTGGIAVAGILRGQDLLAMLETAIALAVAAVPEGLPVVATLTLARGMWRMARRNALIERLSAVETLGATTVVLTDKTGTLTQNRMSVSRYLLHEGDVDVMSVEGTPTIRFRSGGKPVEPATIPALQRAIEIGAKCIDTAPEDAAGSRLALKSDPMEAALLLIGEAHGMDGATLARLQPTKLVHAFDPTVMMMATVHQSGHELVAAIKGAPEQVLARAARELTPDGPRAMGPRQRNEWMTRAEEAAARGIRLLALAENRLDAIDADPFSDLTLVALVGLADPIREDVPEAIRQCREAGVRVVMLTGDHPATAEAIAGQAGLGVGGTPDVFTGSLAPLSDPGRLGDPDRDRILAADVFSRVSPETKLQLVTLYQERGDIVAMTGDGVNDAPALKKSDIGIAMGGRGTEVAREAAAMILKDDSFATIVSAMREGRIIFNNIRLFVIYLLSCNVSEIMVVGFATVVGMPLPLLPLQVLYLNLITDIFPAFAVAMGEGDRDVMRSPPRDPAEPVVTTRHWIDIGVFGALITIATLGAFAIADTVLGLPHGPAITVSFTTIALAQLWNVFNMRGAHESLWSNSISRNPLVGGALALCLALICIAVFVPGLSDILGLTLLGMDAIALVIGASLLPLAGGQLWISLMKPRSAEARGVRK